MHNIKTYFVKISLQSHCLYFYSGFILFVCLFACFVVDVVVDVVMTTQTPLIICTNNPHFHKSFTYLFRMSIEVHTDSGGQSSPAC